MRERVFCLRNENDTTHLIFAFRLQSSFRFSLYQTWHIFFHLSLLQLMIPTVVFLVSSELKRKIPNGSEVTLPRSSYIVWMIFVYASVALTAWIWIWICLLAFKPLTAKRYGFDTRERDSSRLQARFIKSEEIYRAARTVQPIVVVSTVPLTPTVCSATAIVSARAKRQERMLTLRQTMTLADKGLTDPTRITKLLSGRGKGLTSSLLTRALLLNLLGEPLVEVAALLRLFHNVLPPLELTKTSCLYNTFANHTFDSRDDQDPRPSHGPTG